VRTVDEDKTIKGSKVRSASVRATRDCLMLAAVLPAAAQVPQAQPLDPVVISAQRLRQSTFDPGS
jgi:hypothetical protein